MIDGVRDREPLNASNVSYRRERSANQRVIRELPLAKIHQNLPGLTRLFWQCAVTKCAIPVVG
jgi:hypothetical protein